MEAGGHRQERGRPRRPTTPGLTDAELVAKLDEFTDHMRYQWWIHGHINFVLLSSSAFCDLYDKLMRARPSAPSRTRRSRASTPARSTSSGVCGTSAAWPRPARCCASCSSSGRPADAARRPRRHRRGPGLPAPARRVPVRVRLAQRRRVRPRRRAVAGGPDDPAGQRRRPHGPRRQPGPRAALPAAGRAARGADGHPPGPGWPTTRRPLAKFDELYEAARLQLPAHRGPRLLDRPARRQRVPPVRPRLGDRLVAKGVVDQADDVFYLYRDELVDALTQRRRPPRSGRRSGGPASTGPREVIPPGAIGHAAAAARDARPVHGRHRLPPARHGAGRGEPRPERAARRRPARRARTRARPASCARWPRPWTSRRVRSWSAR